MREKISTNNAQKKTGLPEELSYYLSQNPIDRQADPIKYWLSLPELPLSRVALKYLTIIATSVPVERLFSHAKCILNDKRSQLTPRNFQVLLFLTMLPRKYYNL